MKIMWPGLLAVLLFVSIVPRGYAAATSSPVGTVAYVRVYQVGPDGLRAQIGVKGAVHNCKTYPTVYYFDSISSGLNQEVVKAVVSEANVAMTTGKNITVTYDCSLGPGGYAYGIALQVGP